MPRRAGWRSPPRAEAVNETEAAVSRVEDVLHSVEERTLALGEALSVLGPRDADVDPLLRRFVRGNRDLYGAAIAWAGLGTNPTTGRRARAASAADLASEAYRTGALVPLLRRAPGPSRTRRGGEVSMVTFAVRSANGWVPGGS
jgi:hypothetical protein